MVDNNDDNGNNNNDVDANRTMMIVPIVVTLVGIVTDVSDVHP